MNLKLLIDSESFSQNFPIKLSDFIIYCRDRDISVNEEILEYLEEKRLFFPIFRSERFIEDTKNLKKLYSEGLVKEPKNEVFIPWKNFYRFDENSGNEKIITFSFYSTYQIFHIIKILPVITLKFTLNQIKDNYDVFLRDKKFKEKNIDKLLTQSVDVEYQMIFFINYIQNKYLPFVKDSQIIYFADIRLKELDQLMSVINKSKILEKYSIETLKQIRREFALNGYNIDPLKKWFHLVKYIDYKKRKELNGTALLAQYYYLVSDMLNLLIEDLTGEKQSDIYSAALMESSDWMSQLYGKKLNYKDIDTLKIILTDYRINPYPDLLLIVEGHTEEVAIPIILSATNETLEEYRIELYNIQGANKNFDELMKYIGTPTVRKIDGKYDVYFRTRIFLIFDNEGRWKNKKSDTITKIIMNEILKRLPKEMNEETCNILAMDTIKIKVCDKCFEYDNLSNEELIFLLDKYSKKHNNEFKINKSELYEYRQGNINIGDLYSAKTGHGLGKREFGELIGYFLADKIKNGEDDSYINDVLKEVILFSKGIKLN